MALILGPCGGSKRHLLFEPPQGPNISAEMSYLTILCGHHINYVMYDHNMLKGSHFFQKIGTKPQFPSNFENWTIKVR